MHYLICALMLRLHLVQWQVILALLNGTIYCVVFACVSSTMCTRIPVVLELEIGRYNAYRMMFWESSYLMVSFSFFGTVNMRLPFMDFIAATDASTCYGLGGTVASARAEDIRSIARMACKAGGHVRLQDSPELADSLAARLGPRYDLNLRLSDFRVIFSVNIVAPGHINLEEAKALIHLVRWVLRSKRRFCRRLVVLIDSKVVIGGVTKGRSSSVQLNALIRKLAALCFAGNLLLHCVFIPTSHNPADWPSRGPANTWHPALRRKPSNLKVARCPACGVEPLHHPLDQPRRLRGKGLPCRGSGTRFAYDHLEQRWISDFDLCMRRWKRADNTSEKFAAFLDDVLNEDSHATL